jgi:hypothetical protein
MDSQTAFSDCFHSFVDSKAHNLEKDHLLISSPKPTVVASFGID